MIDLFDAWPSIKTSMIGQELLLFLDYDGTLSPIQDLPEQASLPDSTKDLLRSLTEAPLCKVFIVTGRTLDNIKSLIGIDHVGYIGNHGFEMDVLPVEFKSLDWLSTKEVISVLKQEIQQSVAHFLGVVIEDKEVSLSIHYRLVAENDQEAIKSTLENITDPFVAKGQVKASFGKKVFEIKPAIDWNKGKAVLWFLDEYLKVSENNRAIIYIGDDKTDEDAFQVLNSRGITIKVGQTETKANYFVNNQREVISLLQEILDLKKREGYGSGSKF